MGGKTLSIRRIGAGFLHSCGAGVTPDGWGRKKKCRCFLMV
jgi:hypothetical protein